MRKIFSAIFIMTGIVFIAIAAYQYVEQQMNTNRAMAEAEELIAKHRLNSVPVTDKPENGQRLTSSEHAPELDGSTVAQPFTAEKNDVIGILHIPKLDKSLPIIEGADEETLKSGVGRLTSTAYPGENEQILLSGHRDTVFRNFGELEVGDTFIVEMPYGSFEYVMKEAEIVGADDTTVIGPKGEEVLTLSTCYPFRFIGNAPDRYIIYAYPSGA